MIRTAAAWILAASLAAEGLDGLVLADGRILVGTWQPEHQLLTLPGEAVAVRIDPRDIRRRDPLPFERVDGRWRVPAWRWLERTAPEREPYGLVAWNGGFTTRALAVRYRREDGERAMDAADAAARRQEAALDRGGDGDLIRTLSWCGRLMAALSDGSEAADGVACALEHGVGVGPLDEGRRRLVLRAVTIDALALAGGGATWSEIHAEAADGMRISADRGTPLSATAAVAAVLDERARLSGRPRRIPDVVEADRWIRTVLGDEAPAPP